MEVCGTLRMWIKYKRIRRLVYAFSHTILVLFRQSIALVGFVVFMSSSIIDNLNGFNYAGLTSDSCYPLSESYRNFSRYDTLNLPNRFVERFLYSLRYFRNTFSRINALTYSFLYLIPKDSRYYVYPIG